MKPKHIVIVAGEESGDQHAADFVKILKQSAPHIQFSGIGGQHMQAAGVDLLCDLARFGVTGLSSVVAHARIIRNAYKQIKAHLEKTKPDLLVLVDYPGFNLRLAQYAKQKLGLRIVYYISPQIWAWKAGRIKNIKANIDHMAVILPFEKAIYQKAGVAASFVGHPLLDKMPKTMDMMAERVKLALAQDKTLMALLPGSRRGEINFHMPILVDMAKALSKEFPKLHFVMPVAQSLSRSWVESFWKDTHLPIHFIDGQARETMLASDCVVVASGTASLECALLQKPMCIIYKASRLSYLIALKVIRIRYFGLCNLLMNGMIVPELLQDDCTKDTLVTLMRDILQNPSMSTRMVARLHDMRESLSAGHADCTIADLIAREVAT